MLFTIASGVVFTEISSRLTNRSRSLSDNDKDFWNTFELRALVVLSLSMHVILIGLGYGKNKKGKAWIHNLTWISYHVGDWVATVSLTTLLKRQKKEINAVEVFWAPFLLLHLGSAETLAAHFVHEGELWLRYFVGLLIQSGIAFYVYWTLHTGSATFNYIANLIFIAGIIKCAERIWILRSSSFNQLRNSVLSASPPKISASVTDDDKSYCKNMPRPKKLQEYLSDKNIIQEGRYLHEAYLSFKMFRPLFWDLKLGIYKRLSYIFQLDQSMTAKEAFKMIATELGFLYDVLYTKTTLCTSVTGLILRSIFLLFSLTAFIAFSLIISKIRYWYTDIIITYLLLLGAIFADSLALSSHIFSKWTVRRLTTTSNTRLQKCFNKTVAYWLKYRKGRKGIKCMAQHSLLTHCLKTKFNAGLQIIGVSKILDFFQFDKRVKVDLELKEFIFCHIKKKREQYEKQSFELDSLARLMDNGAYELLKSRKLNEELGWSIKEIEFTHTLLLWHIATEILYYNHRRKYPFGHLNQHCRLSKVLSDYMMHLLVKRPFMLHIGIGELRYRDTFSEAMKFLQQEMRIQSAELAATTLLGLDVQCRVFLLQMRGEGKSVFFDGCRLAKELQSLVREHRWDYEEMWEMIKVVWVEMLISAAYNCNWKEHAKQLGHGIELLTHVTLLMAHLGLSKHIRMTELPQELEQIEGYNPPWDWEKLNQLAYYLA
ncbi:hypothetical protein CCACVL1_18719 [Corchorus capsularis]|uniref:DUF4220 domain-containing protein n=1 Tax=Corchorus capsularis TaxID=210143 RepID=A0A1R3HK50_COCAP|nr:hypothetical protein CCACVL1_18719 [Corchorus capsularis]